MNSQPVSKLISDILKIIDKSLEINIDFGLILGEIIQTVLFLIVISLPIVIALANFSPLRENS